MRPLPILACLLAFTAAAEAAPRKAAVFDLELVNTSQEAAHQEEDRRIAAVSRELRDLLGRSDQVTVVDTSPKAAEIERLAPFSRCNGCEEDIARALGADLSVTGVVQKTSNLILSFMVEIHDLKANRVIRGGQVDIRGNTDESWMRGIRYLVKNRLLAEPLPEAP